MSHTLHPSTEAGVAPEYVEQMKHCAIMASLLEICEDGTSLIDLHCHTNASDGQRTPEELVAKAIERELSAIAVTDHDTIAGVQRVIDAATGTDLEIVPGIEFSSYHMEREIHILGFFIPLDDPAFNDYINELTVQREERGRKMIENINAIGYELAYEEAARISDGAPLMSPHIVRALHEKGTLKSSQEAVQFYQEHMVHGADVYIDHNVPIEDVLGILDRLRCPTAIAHPHKIGDDDVVADLIKMGVQGLEAYYPDTDEAVLKHYRDWAEREGLFVSGGSDYHGVYAMRKLGSAYVPDEVLEKIKVRRDELRG
jgi:predicted metal-dependent phosphoesterase TrpH